jgi:hypothetical protein
MVLNLTEVFQPTCREVVKHHYRVAIRKQALYQVTAYETSATGDQAMSRTSIHI